MYIVIVQWLINLITNNSPECRSRRRSTLDFNVDNKEWRRNIFFSRVLLPEPSSRIASNFGCVAGVCMYLHSALTYDYDLWHQTCFNEEFRNTFDYVLYLSFRKDYSCLLYFLLSQLVSLMGWGSKEITIRTQWNIVNKSRHLYVACEFDKLLKKSKNCTV